MMGGHLYIYSRRVKEESKGVKLLSDGAFTAAGLISLGFEYKDHTQWEKMAKAR